MTLEQQIFESLDNAYEAGDFAPGGYLHGYTAEMIAEDMLAYDAACEGYSAKSIIPHIQAWMEK